MSTIFLDPVQMDATAGNVGAHVNELTTLTADLETACSAPVPISIAGWLAEELRDITVIVRLVALIYTVAALDTAQRAQQIQADQSLATAVPPLAPTSATFTGAPLVGGFGAFGSMVTVPDYTGGSPGASVVGGFMLGASGPNIPLGGYTPGSGGGSSSLPIFDIPGYASTNTMLLSTPGRTYLGNNIYEGSGMTGSFSSVLPDPDADY